MIWMKRRIGMFRKNNVFVVVFIFWAACGSLHAEKTSDTIKISQPNITSSDTPTSNLLQQPVSSDDKPTSDVLALLERIESRYGNMRYLTVDFEQVKVQEIFEDVTHSKGRLLIDWPDRLRCDYNSPEPSTLWFIKNIFYQYTPSIKQVDKYVYDSQEDAQRDLRLMMLSFGLSTSEVLENYQVESAGENDQQIGLRFLPKDEQIARQYQEFQLWLDQQSLLPNKVFFRDASGDTTTLTMTSISVDDPIDPDLFQLDFSKDTEIIEYKNK